ncbi:MAG: TonB-dependent receptor [Gammaproteobacteria bacterium]|jgi:iron complex outermembrane receptor protein|nr:TonB-dependent receptor [Gammaproteobacteria bacterium]
MLSLIRKRLALASLLMFLASLGLVWSPVMAQDEDSETEEDVAEQTEEDEDEEESADLGKVQVTGSLIRRAEYSSTSPVQVITAETQARVGQVDTSEFLQRSSVAAGATQFNNTFSGFVIEGGTGVNSLSLRGLGAQRTLVVLNNRRPGPAGTRGQVGAFDLNVIPSVIVQRAEILKDGASSIYGSDAVAGVANVITRKNIEGGELSIQASVPEQSGGAVYDAEGAYGWNFRNGSIVVAGEYHLQEELAVGDRDFLSCGQDIFTDADGNRIDREDRSILAGTELGGCDNLYANTVIDAIFGDRYIPAPDGVTVGMIPGYRPRANGRYDDPAGEAFYEDVLNFPFYGSASAINRQERISLYGASEFNLDFAGGVTWDTEWLYNKRETEARGWRQFFPLMAGANAQIPGACGQEGLPPCSAFGFGYPDNPTFTVPVPSGIAQPVMPYPSNTDIAVDYYYVATGLEGTFGNSLWTWTLDASYSRSDGDYTRNSIVASRSGDIDFDPDGPDVDYFSPGILSGQDMATLVDAVGAVHTGNTVYDQFVTTAIVTGDTFQLPAGPVGVALGAEYRDFSIDDEPSALAQGGNLWGESSAQVTQGEDSVVEAFAEVEVPILAGKPGFESLTFNASGRVFDYDSTGSDSVWKAGLNWQINPTVRLRSTYGTSYRSPALYELYLGDQTAFVGQLAIDPCINWGESTNEFIRQNCSAAGIPDDFAGGASSATVVSGGGLGVLEPETSEAFTAGLIMTPSFADFSIAVDYFEMEVEDQVSQLGGAAILGGCYGSENFPNAFCDLFDRNSGDNATAPFAITEVRDSFLNVNKQKTRGVDVNFRYDGLFSFGRLVVENQSTWVFEDLEQLFDPSLAQGFDDNNRNGTIGRPKLVSNTRIDLNRDDWTFTWYAEYIRRTDEKRFVDEETTYFGFDPAYRDITAESGWINSVSVLYEQSKWSVLAGVRNIFNEKPPIVSSGVVARRGNYPISATQYSLRGRTGYLRFNYYF